MSGKAVESGIIAMLIVMLACCVYAAAVALAPQPDPAIEETPEPITVIHTYEDGYRLGYAEGYQQGKHIALEEYSVWYPGE